MRHVQQAIFTFRETFSKRSSQQKCTLQLNKPSCLYKEIDFSLKQPAAFSHTAGTPGKNTHIVFESVCVYTGRDLSDNNNIKKKNVKYNIQVIPFTLSQTEVRLLQQAQLYRWYNSLVTGSHSHRKQLAEKLSYSQQPVVERHTRSD